MTDEQNGRVLWGLVTISIVVWCLAVMLGISILTCFQYRWFRRLLGGRWELWAVGPLPGFGHLVPCN